MGFYASVDKNVFFKISICAASLSTVGTHVTFLSSMHLEVFL